MAKRILRDPNLSLQATRKFNVTVDQVRPGKLLVAGAEVKDLIGNEKEEEKDYEVELHM